MSNKEVLSTHDTRDEAWDAARKVAASLVRRKLQHLHSVKVEQRKGVWWVVLCSKR